MKVNQKGKGNDLFRTPKELFKQLNDIFAFDTDAACNSDNALCPNGFYNDQGIDGLKESWAGKRIFCNPPFSEKGKWIEKAVSEISGGGCHICVMVLPTNSMDSKPWHQHIYGKFHYEILEGRIQFIDPETLLPGQGNNSGTTIIYFWRKPSTRLHR